MHLELDNHGDVKVMQTLANLNTNEKEELDKIINNDVIPQAQYMIDVLGNKVKITNVKIEFTEFHYEEPKTVQI